MKLFYRFKFTPQRIYNLDETGVTTVQNPGRVVSSKGKRQVGATSSQERGELSTLCCCVNAAGMHIPPFFIFPRVHMKNSFMNGAPPGARGEAAKTGYMNGEIFAEKYLPFLISQTHCTVDEPILLILDNHSSHISLQVVELCKNAGIVLLTLPPHTSHKLQPLDRSVYGPLKTFYYRALDDWMRTYPGRSVSIYEVGQLTSKAFGLSMTPVNIQSGFRASGIHPFNRDIFTDDEFQPAEVTDQPIEGQRSAGVEPTPTTVLAPSTPSNSDHPINQSSTAPTSGITVTAPSTKQMMLVTPEHIVPLPKAPARKPSNRRKVRCAILTDTPEKKELEDAQNTKNAKKKKEKKVRKRKQPTESDEEEAYATQLESEMILSTDSESADENEMEMPASVTADSVIKSCHVLVRYRTERKTDIYYAGVVVDVADDGYAINFLHKVKGTAASFIYPEKEDCDHVTLEAITMILGDPVSAGGTSRSVARVMFQVDLSEFNIQ